MYWPMQSYLSNKLNRSHHSVAEFKVNSAFFWFSSKGCQGGSMLSYQFLSILKLGVEEVF